MLRKLSWALKHVALVKGQIRFHYEVKQNRVFTSQTSSFLRSLAKLVLFKAAIQSPSDPEWFFPDQTPELKTSCPEQLEIFHTVNKTDPTDQLSVLELE